MGHHLLLVRYSSRKVDQKRGVGIQIGIPGSSLTHCTPHLLHSQSHCRSLCNLWAEALRACLCWSAVLIGSSLPSASHPGALWQTSPASSPWWECLSADDVWTSPASSCVLLTRGIALWVFQKHVQLSKSQTELLLCLPDSVLYSLPFGAPSSGGPP